MFLKYNFNKVKNIIPLQKNSEHMSKVINEGNSRMVKLAQGRIVAGGKQTILK